MMAYSPIFSTPTKRFELNNWQFDYRIITFIASILILTTFSGNNKPKPSLNATSTQGLVNPTLKPHPTFRKRFQIYCRTGFRLVVLPDGHVMGTFNNTIAKKYGDFEFQSFGRSVIRMKNIATQRYVAIRRTGKVFTTSSPTNETLLKEHRMNNSFYSFYSLIYEDKKNKKHFYLAVKRNGHMKNARKVLPRHKSFQFLTIDEPKKVDPLGRILRKFGLKKLLRNLNSTRELTLMW